MIRLKSDEHMEAWIKERKAKKQLYGVYNHEGTRLYGVIFDKIRLCNK